MLEIGCSECGVTGSIFLCQSIYEGPYRCWKCRSLFTVRIENNEMKWCTPLSEEEFEQWQGLRDFSSRKTGE